jgi:ABC-type transporter Mla subunit MlaD
VNTQRTDFLVGLFILIAAGVVVGVAIVTSGLGERRTELYVRATSAEALTQDTRVVLRGLSVGRVREINPVVDSTTGAIEFLVRLGLRDRFPNGTRLVLPAGTHAVISQPTPIAPAVIDLVLPDEPAPGAYLTPGDTIASERPEDLLSALGVIAADLREEVKTTLRDTRALLQRSTGAIAQTQTLLATSTPLLTDVLQRLSSNLERTDQLLADVAPRIGPLDDSVTLVLADTRQALARADSLMLLASDIAAENRPVARDIADRLLRTVKLLEYFTDQVGRRPTRFLTGVRPPPDSLLRRADPDTTRDKR